MSAPSSDRPVLFISDLHLAAERQDIVDLAIGFLRGPARAAQAVYILGDLFEYWIGDDDAADPVAPPVLEAIAALGASGVPVAVMHGNRDFLLGARAAARARFTLLADPTTVDLFGRRAVILHGDTLCTDDRAYQRYRRIIRSRVMRAGFSALPFGLRHRAAGSLRAKSESAKQAKSSLLMDVNAAAVEQAFAATGVDLMIHGHTHRPAHHRIIVAGRACDRYVLADWYRHGSYLEVTRERIAALDWQG